MRTASKVLGIAGGALAILIAVIVLISGIAVMNTVPSIIDDALEYSDGFNFDSDDFNFDNGEFNFDNGEFSFDGSFDGYGAVQGIVVTGLIFVCVISIIGGVLGIVGGVLAKKKNVVAGVLMLVGCVLAGFSGWGIFCSIALLVGGILALVKEKPAQAAYPYPYSGYSQQAPPPPYNPYQQQQQQPYNPYQPQQPPYNPYQAPQAPPAPPAPPQEPEAPKSEE